MCNKDVFYNFIRPWTHKRCPILPIWTSYGMSVIIILVECWSCYRIHLYHNVCQSAFPIDNLILSGRLCAWVIVMQEHQCGEMSGETVCAVMCVSRVLNRSRGSVRNLAVGPIFYLWLIESAYEWRRYTFNVLSLRLRPWSAINIKWDPHPSSSIEIINLGMND